MVPNLPLQGWTKDRIDEVREAEGHTSYDSVVKSLLRDRALVREVLSNDSQLKSPSASASMSVANGGENTDLPGPSPENRTVLALGNTGKGKSVTFAYQAHRLLERDDETAVVVLDQHGSYSRLCHTHDGQRVALSRSVNRSLNPLDIQQPGHSDDGAAPTATEHYRLKLDEIQTFFRISLDQSAEYDHSLSRVLLLAVQATYEDAGITDDPSTHGRQSPTITAVEETLADMTEEPGRFGTTDAEQARIAEDAAKAAAFLREFRPGNKYAEFAGQTAITLDETGFTQIVLPDEYNGLSGLRVHTLITSLSQQAAMQSRDLIVILDDTHQFFQYESAIDSLLRRTRHSRPTYGSQFAFWATSQSPDPLTATGTGSTLLETADRLYLHGISGHRDRLKRQLDLSDEQSRYVQSASHGTEDSGAQVLMRDEQREWAPYRVEIPEDVLESVTTSNAAMPDFDD